MSEETSIKVPIFDGRNFGLWKKRVIVAMKVKKCQAAIEVKAGIETKLTDHQENTAQMILLNSLDANVAQKIQACDTAADIWSRLLTIYESTSAINVGQLLEQYYSYKKGPGDDMSTHISKVEALAIQLEQVNQKQSDESVMSKLLHSLPENFAALKEAWDSVSEAERTRDNLTARLLRYDAQASQQETTKAFVATEIKDKSKTKKRIKCYNCGKMGNHFARDCRSPKAKRPDQESNTGRSEPGVAMVIGNPGIKSDGWVADSGAGRHTCCRREWFSSYEDHHEELEVGNQDMVVAKGKGTIVIKSRVGKTTHHIRLENVLYVPAMRYNLFSARQASKKSGSTTSFGAAQCKIMMGGKEMIRGSVDATTGLYMLDVAVEAPKVMLTSTKRCLEDWHKAMGHVDPAIITQMAQNKSVEGLEIIQKDPSACQSCPAGKATRAPHTWSSSRAVTEVGEVVDMDLIGPINKESLGGRRYVMLAGDRFSNYMHVGILKSKDEVYDKLQTFIGNFEAQSGRRIRAFQADHGSEFDNSKVRTLCGVEHIEQLFSSPYTPEQNGTAERRNRTILNDARTMLVASGLPGELWAEAVVTAVYIRNRVAKRGSHVTPYELYTGRRPFVGHLVQFGKPVQSLINDRRQGKFDAKTEPGFVVGFTDRSNTYRVYLPGSNKVKETCDIIFRAIEFPAPMDLSGRKSSQVVDWPSSLNSAHEPSKRAIDTYFDELGAREGETTPDERSVLREEELRTPPPEGAETPCTCPSAPPEPQPETPPRTTSMSQRESFSTLSPGHEQWIQSPMMRARAYPDMSQIYANDLPTTEATQRDHSPFLGRQLPRTPTKKHGALIVAQPSTPSELPNSFKQAMESPQRASWKNAVAAELLAHQKNKTWTVAQRPINTQPLTTKWVFTVKRKSTGEVELFKGRLVAHGYKQVPGIDFQETYSPVARNVSIRSLLAVATAKDLHLEMFD